MSTSRRTSKRQVRIKKGYVPRAPSASSIVRQEMAKVLERKYQEVYHKTAVVPTNGALQLLTGMAQGATVAQRIGNSVTLKSITFRGYFGATALGTAAGVVYRFVIVQWIPNSTPTIGQIIEANPGNDFCMEHFNHENKGKQFKVLYDSGAFWLTTPTATNLINTNMWQGLPLTVIPFGSGLKQNYTTGSNDSDNRIYLVYGATIANTVDQNVQIRVAYTDG